jgi:hypothetical protein
MSANGAEPHAVIEELTDALQTAVLLAAKLATGLRADAREADVLYQAITRATTALQRLRPKGSAR